ncbi:hypothetical protein AWB78_08613 [Caballeronia calidae]|uniref:Uncharacterized protein n=1 Tax=Caballeronia calidae TaxID=1777139 RepID=A0A158EKX5_9BURK|nr:hypothetical protein AWB78_08613 [Caballeronia calidae]
MPLGRRFAHLLRVVGVTALAANRQPLQQALRHIIPTLTCQLAVLGKLLLNSMEQRFTHDGRHRNFDPLLPVRTYRRIGFPGHIGAMALGTYAYQMITHLRFAERSPPHVRRIAQYAPYHTAVPERLARCRHGTRLRKPAHHFAYAQAVHPHPLEDRPDCCCLGQFDNVAGRRSVQLPADVAVAIGRPGQYIDAAAFCAVKLATTVTLGDLRPLVLRDHALHLQQQRLFRRRPDCVIEEYDLHAAGRELFHQQRLVRIFARQAVR